jgi:hypothetical protein
MVNSALYYGAFFADLATRLGSWRRPVAPKDVCGPRGAHPTHPAARGHGRRIPPWLEPAETLLFAAACIKSGWVKFCPAAIDKMAIHPFGAALSDAVPPPSAKVERAP